MAYPNNSFIFIIDIGQTNDTSTSGLQCITDRKPCCKSDPNRQGEWFFPDGGLVPRHGAINVTTFYRTRGDDGTVNLNRVNDDVLMPTGKFCCVVPDATGISQRTCAIICE